MSRMFREVPRSRKMFLAVQV